MDKQPTKNTIITLDIHGQNEGICRTGVPFPMGKVSSLNQLELRQHKKKVKCFARSLCCWPDGSIKWITLGFFHPIQDTNQYDLVILDTYNPKQPLNASLELQVQNSDEELVVSTSEFQFFIDKKTLSLNIKSSHNQRELLHISSLGASLSLRDNQQIIGKLNHWSSLSSQDLSDGACSAFELKLEGHFEYPTNKQPLQFVTVIEFYQALPFIKIQTTLHNPNPAKHPEGRWDLGDEGSELFKSLSFELDLAKNDSLTYRPSIDSEQRPIGANTKIIQHASGGTNWRSPVHVNKNNQVELETNGFEVTSDNIQIAHGNRATPILHSNNNINLTVEKFWQNFPTAFAINNSNIRIELFPANTNNSYHELQGGEKKSHTFWLNFSNQSNNLNWVHSPPIAKPNKEWLAKCQALPIFLATTEEDPIIKLIRSGLEHTDNFFAKREAIDEYGWRNFGDLYADHETLGYTGHELFISHYNNQYDPIYGFLKQFILTGDTRWFELADDLAKHVKDIDIYHTTEDRAEYNGGLFWHTDHYLPACTATHRSFSKRQESGAYEDHAGGGGPGGQHCYTTGLVYHYLLTGAEDSKQAVLTLTNWITHSYEGTGTCLELLLAVKNRHLLGLKDHISGQYPLDRGTANYIIALLDSYQLTQDKDYLQRVEHIIHHTAHPADNINERHLDNVEESWFYTVFLQAVSRYLFIKETKNTLDDAFYYARDVLLHYADWMLTHEYPYLEKPEILEFPNEAWTAQEPRKAHILAAAYYYSPERKQAYLDKARFFQDYVIKRLSTSPETTYTRTLVLLMQNQGMLEYYASLEAPTLHPPQQWPEASYHHSPRFAAGLVRALAKRLMKLSIHHEIQWLKMRIGK